MAVACPGCCISLLYKCRLATQLVALKGDGFYRPPQLKSVHGLWPAVTLAGSIDRDVASHVCPTQRGLGSEVGLSAWDLDRWGGLRALTSKFEGP